MHILWAREGLLILDEGMNMNDKWEKLYAALKDINNNYGADIVSAPNKVKNLLLDFAPGIPNEVKTFSNVICEQDINRYISSGAEIQMDYLVSRIEDNMGLSAEWAQKIAVGIFALLDKSVPVIEQTTQEKKKTEPQTAPTTVTKTTKTPPKSKPQKTQSYEQQLISSGYSRLSTGLWDKAMESFDNALRTSSYPKAYVGKMMATLHIRKESEIPLSDREFETDTNWIKAKNNATGSYKDKLLRYEREHRAHLSRIKQSKQSKPVQPTATQKQVVQSQQTSTKAKKEPSNFGMVMCVLGLLLLLATVIFGLYAWFAETGLSLLTYYLIMLGASCVGTLLAFSDGGFKETLRCLAMFGLGIPAAVTVIGLIGDLIIWIVKLF